MTTVALEVRQSRVRRPEPPPHGLDRLAHAVMRQTRRLLRPAPARLLAEAEDIHRRSVALAGLATDVLLDRIAETRDAFRRRPNAEPNRIADALVLVAEAAARVLDKRPYPVQLMGALALSGGAIAEMATGEGKTLTAALQAILAAWTGRPVHVLTANDYLVARDAGLLAPLYQFCGLSVGHVADGMEREARRAGYARDVTYATAKEVLADFLRDRIALGPAREVRRRLLRAALDPECFGAGAVVMRGLDTAIVDEADSLLVDEAVTPLIISRPAENRPLREGALAGRAVAERLCPGEHYVIDAGRRQIRFTEAGRAAVAEAAAGLPAMWRGSVRREDLIRQALTAKELYRRDQHYILHDGKVVIVDEFTGRMMPGRSWSSGLHQAVEAKEGVELTDPTEVQAQMSFQHFFRHYRRLGGMTGTAAGLAGELWQVYGLEVVPVPTHLPCRRVMVPDRLFAGFDDKWQAVSDAVAEHHRAGRPVLVGTSSIATSEALVALLAERGITAQVLNALRHESEAAVVAAAGYLSTITIATNMAGRGTDIALGFGVANLGGLHVIATERHDARRIDRQLFGRAARQGDPGSAETFLSLDDALAVRILPPALRRVAAAMVGRPAVHPLLRRLFDLMQWLSERRAYGRRQALLRADLLMQDALAFSGDGTG